MRRLIDNSSFVYQRNAILFCICIVVLFALKQLGQIVFPFIVNTSTDIYTFFTIVFPFVYLFVPKRHVNGKRSQKSLFVNGAFITSVTLIAIQFIAAFLFRAFGESPYDLSPLSMLKNIFPLLFSVITLELIRHYILHTYYLNKLVIILLTFILYFGQFPFYRFQYLTTPKSICIFIFETAIPLLVEEIFLTFICIFGGYKAALTYKIPLKVMIYILPVLPNLEWIISGVIKLTIPSIAGIIIWDLLSQGKRHLQRTDRSAKKTIIEISCLFAIVALIWFQIGVFPIYPTIIVTGSMEPLIHPGDMLLVRKVTDEEQIWSLKTGDIIIYRRDNILIAHRIYSIHTDENGNLTFTTKGDNNSTEDSESVDPNAIKGTFFGVIPKIGYLNYLIRTGSSEIPDNVTF